MKRNTRVCHFTSVHPWNDIRIFQKQCISLANNGFEVFLVAPDAPEGTHEKVNVVSVKSTGSGRINRFLKLRKQVFKKALEIDADIYHFHDPELLPYAVKLQKKGKKVIYDSHEDVPMQILSKPWIKPLLLRKLISFFYNRYEKQLVNKLSGAISVIDSITEKFRNSNKTTIFNYPKIVIESNVNNEKIHLSDKFKIVYHGGLTSIRGTDVIISAMNYLDEDCELVLMGNWESEAYMNYCKSLKGWGSVNYLGYMDYNSVFNVLKNSQLGLVILKNVPNYINSLPIKAFEYISVSIPVIMSDFSFWKQEFGTYAQFVNPENPEELAKKITEIKNKYNEEKARVEIESKKIMHSKTWLSQEKKLVEFYNKIIK